MEYLQLLFPGTRPEQKEMLIAVLSEWGFYGFEEEDDSLKAFAKTNDVNKNKLNLIKQLSGIKYTESIIKEENWNAVWEAGFEPVGINELRSNNPFAYIRADFHAAEPSYTHDIVITPKMSFGTGHHATTYLMVTEMSKINFADKTVIDFGTGTGILAILAEKMGATSVTAVDCDDWSIDNANENIKANGCKKILVMKGETLPTGNRAGIILANINLNIIRDSITAIKNAMLPGSVAIFSGIMSADEGEILRIVEQGGLRIGHISKRENWLALYAVN